MVVGFTLTVQSVPNTIKVVSSNPCSWQGVLNTTIYDIKFVSGFLQVLQFPPPIKLNDITEILMKVSLNTITQPTLSEVKLGGVLCQ